MRKLNQDDYLSIIVRDLGKIPTKTGKTTHRCAEFLCIACSSVYVRNVYKAKSNNTGMCKHCTDVKKSTSHGGSKTPLYKVWDSMVSRCHNINDKDYPRYGAAGVIVCDEWRTDFAKFRDWATENHWEKGKYHIDKDLLSEKLGVVPAMYSPETCILVTPKKNNQIMNNKRKLPFYVYFEKGSTKKPYRVRVKMPDKKLKYCGSFSTVEEATEVRDKYMKENNIVY